MPSRRSPASRLPVRSGAGWSTSNRTSAGHPANRKVLPRPTAPTRPPGWVDTILAGLSSIPRKEPIIDDLVRVRAFNERVAYIADLTQTNYPQIEAALHETDQDLRGGELSKANVGQVMTAMNQRARQRLGSGYAAYVRLKLQGIANDVADIVAGAYAYPPDSGRPASCARSCWPRSPTGSLPIGRR